MHTLGDSSDGAGHGAPDPHMRPGLNSQLPASAVVGTWEVDQQIGDFSLPAL